MLITPSRRQWLKSQPIYSHTALLATMIWHSVLLSARLSEAIIRPLEMACIGLLAYSERCSACGNMLYHFFNNQKANLVIGEAYHVCKRCDAKEVKGTVDCSGYVVWSNGNEGDFSEDGEHYRKRYHVRDGDGSAGNGGF